jgi:hypothetical protein
VRQAGARGGDDRELDARADELGGGQRRSRAAATGEEALHVCERGAVARGGAEAGSVLATVAPATPRHTPRTHSTPANPINSPGHLTGGDPLGGHQQRDEQQGH